MDRIEGYRRSTHLNYSTLKTIAYNPKWIEWKRENPESEDDEKEHLRIGSALDCLLTNPEHFQQEFSIDIVERPFGYMGKFIENLPLDLQPDDPHSKYEEAYASAGFKMSLERVIKQFWGSDKNKTYYTARQKAHGRKILSVDEYDTVMFCKKELLTNSFTQGYFIPGRDTQILFQIPIYFIYKGISMKGMLDGIVIDHKNKTVQPYDLKTTGKGTWSFPSEFINRSYFIQAAAYQVGLRCLMNGEKGALSTHPRLTDSLLSLMREYKLLNIQFVVVPKVTKEGARIFQCTDSDLKCAIEGGYIRGGKFIEGLDNLLDRFIWHTDEGKWEYPREVYENSGITELNAYTESIDMFPNTNVREH